MISRHFQNENNKIQLKLQTTKSNIVIVRRLNEMEVPFHRSKQQQQQIRDISLSWPLANHLMEIVHFLHVIYDKYRLVLSELWGQNAIHIRYGNDRIALWIDMCILRRHI